MSDPALLDLLDRALNGAKPGLQVELYGTDATETTLRTQDGALDSVWQASVRGVAARVLNGHRLGHAYTTDTSDAGIATAIERARDTAAAVRPDPALGLPQPMARAEAGHSLAPPMGIDQKVAAVEHLDRAARNGHPLVAAVANATVGDGARTVAIVSSSGVRAAYRRSEAYATVEVLAGARGEQVSAGGMAVNSGVAEIDLEAVARDGVRRAVRLVGGQRPVGATVPVVLDPMAAASVVGVLGQLVSAERCQRGHSLFAGRVGEQVAAAAMSLADDGRWPDGPRSAPWDAEGVPTQRTPVIDRGVLRSLLHNTLTARRAEDGSHSTGNAYRRSFRALPRVGATNLLLDPGDGPPEELVARIGKGFYCQSLMGVQAGVNTLTGQFSCGATGLMIRDGELAEPVRETTIAAAIPTILNGIVAVADDLRMLPSGASGRTLLVGEMTLSGT